MNIIKVQQTFKRLPDEKVAEYVRDPALGFIALMELNERKKERDSYQAQSQQPDMPLSERIPQELGLMSGAAPSAPPPTMPAIQPMGQPMEQPMQQPQGMAGGGMVAFQDGGDIASEVERLRRLAEARVPEDTTDTQRVQALARARQQMPPRTTTANPTAAAPQAPGLSSLFAQIPAEFKPPTSEEEARTKKEFLAEREKELPDRASGLMEAYIKNLEGRRVSEEDARRQMFRDFGIAALKGGSRDFFQNIGGAAEAAVASQAASKKANQQLEDMAQQQRLDIVKYQDARKEGRLKEAEALNERIYDRRNKMLTQATGLAALQDQLQTSGVQRQKMMAEIKQAQESGALNPLKAQLLMAQIKAASLDPSGMAGVRANDYRQAYQDVMESEGRKLEADMRKKYEALAGKNFMQNSVHAANFQQDLDDEIKRKIFARFGVTDPKMQRVIQDVPKRAAVLGD
jgi:hypothetical protein